MQFIFTDEQGAIDQISAIINQALSSGSVMLLVSGGSNIKSAVKIRGKLNLKNNLTIGLVDERYGKVGHPDSNWQKLLDAGLNTQNISLMPVLNGDDVDSATRRYSNNLEIAFEQHDTCIGLLGMGSDGHTSGILPNSPAVDSSQLVTHYVGPDFKRITTTAKSLQMLDQGLLMAFGESKRQQLEELKKDIAASAQPVQILKKIPQFLIFNDQVKD